MVEKFESKVWHRSVKRHEIIKNIFGLSRVHARLMMKLISESVETNFSQITL